MLKLPATLLIVQKNEGKQELSTEEKYLAATISQENEFASYHFNSYIHQHSEIIAGDEIKAGKNQYGRCSSNGLTKILSYVYVNI